MAAEQHPMFTDQDGQPLDVLEWGRRFEDAKTRTLAQDQLDKVKIKTLWHGTNVPELDVKPFGTAVIVDGEPLVEVEQYDDQRAAMIGHQAHYWAVRNGAHCGVCARGEQHG